MGDRAPAIALGSRAPRWPSDGGRASPGRAPAAGARGSSGEAAARLGRGRLARGGRRRGPQAPLTRWRTGPPRRARRTARGRDGRAVGPPRRGGGLSSMPPRTGRPRPGRRGRSGVGSSSSRHRSELPTMAPMRMPTDADAIDWVDLSGVRPRRTGPAATRDVPASAWAVDARPRGRHRRLVLSSRTTSSPTPAHRTSRRPRGRGHRTRSPPDPRHGRPVGCAGLRAGSWTGLAADVVPAGLSSSRAWRSTGGPGRPWPACSRTPAWLGRGQAN